jgi:hypothetical protein
MPVSVEESIFFAAPDGARRSEKLVVQGRWRSEPQVAWSFTRVGDPKGAGSSDPAKTEDEPELF